MQEFIVETPDGQGEAIKEDRNQPWHVALPTGDFDFYGDVTAVRAEIKRRLKVQYPKSGANP